MPPAPSLAIIIREVVARDEANQKALHSMEYQETDRSERLDDKGHAIQRQEVRMLVRPGTAHEVQVLAVKGDDMPTNPDEAVRQAQGKSAQRTKITFALKDMTNRFHISLVGTNTFQGQPVYVVAFTPKPDQPYRDQTEKVLNNLHGRMWISTKDYSVLKTEATLAQPVEVAWIFAAVTALDFHYELDNTTGGMGPAYIKTYVVVHAPFISIRQRMDVDMTEFQPRDKTALGEK
jgi:hypothetical protein